MPNGGIGNCGYCANNILRGARMSYVGYCRVHRLCVTIPLWATCKNLCRWDLTLAGWERWQQQRRDHPQEAAAHPHSDAHPAMEAAGAQSDGKVYATGKAEPILDLPTLADLAQDQRLRQQTDAIRAGIELLELESDPAACLARLRQHAAASGPFDLLLAANELRHLVRQRVNRSLLAQGFRAVLVRLDDADAFRYFHDPFDTVAATLYLAWEELPSDWAERLAAVPDWAALRADEDLLARYNDLYAPDRLSPRQDTSSDRRLIGLPGQGVWIDMDAVRNPRRHHRLSALFEHRAVKGAMHTLERPHER